MWLTIGLLLTSIILIFLWLRREEHTVQQMWNHAKVYLHETNPHVVAGKTTKPILWLFQTHPDTPTSFEVLCLCSWFAHNRDQFEIAIVSPATLGDYLPNLPSMSLAQYPFSRGVQLQVALALLHTYGGMIIPSSRILCMQSVYPVYSRYRQQKCTVLWQSLAVAPWIMAPQRMCAELSACISRIEKAFLDEQAMLQTMFRLLRKHCTVIEECPFLAAPSWEFLLGSVRNQDIEEAIVVLTPERIPSRLQWFERMSPEQIFDSDMQIRFLLQKSFAGKQEFGLLVKHRWNLMAINIPYTLHYKELRRTHSK